MGRIRRALRKAGNALRWMDTTAFTRKEAENLAQERGLLTGEASYRSLFPRGKAVYNPKTMEVEFHRKPKGKGVFRSLAGAVKKPFAHFWRAYTCHEVAAMAAQSRKGVASISGISAKVIDSVKTTGGRLVVEVTRKGELGSTLYEVDPHTGRARVFSHSE